MKSLVLILASLSAFNTFAASSVIGNWVSNHKKPNENAYIKSASGTPKVAVCKGGANSEASNDNYMIITEKTIQFTQVQRPGTKAACKVNNGKYDYTYNATAKTIALTDDAGSFSVTTLTDSELILSE